MATESIEVMIARIDERTKHIHADLKNVKIDLAKHVRDDRVLEARVRKNERFRAACIALGLGGSTAGGWSLWNLFS